MTGFAAALLLLLPAVPLANAFRFPGFRRRLGLFPRTLLLLVAGLAVYVAAVTALVLTHPGYAAAAAVVVSLAAAWVAFWRARPGYGKRKRLPPGTLKIAPTGPWADFLHYRKLADRHGPVFKMTHFVRPMVCIADLALGREFLQRHDRDTMTPPMPFNDDIPDGFMRYMAPEVHREYRSRMKTLFTDPEFLDQRSGPIRDLIRRTVAAMAQRVEPVNPVPAISDMTFTAFAGFFFAIEPGDAAFGRLRACYATIDYRAARLTRRKRAKRALSEIETIVLGHALERDCYFGRFVAARARERDGPPVDTTLIRNFIFLLQTSWIDVTDLLVWVFKLLGDHPRWTEALRADLASGDPERVRAASRLADRIVRETLRLEQSEYLMRRAIRDIDFAGFHIPRGWLVRICVRESHRDPSVFPDPHAFDPDRFRDAVPSRLYAPFGMQQKSCLGASVTLWMGREFALALAQGPCWDVVRDGPRELGAFHWRPSVHYRVRAAATRSSRASPGKAESKVRSVPTVTIPDRART